MGRSGVLFFEVALGIGNLLEMACRSRYGGRRRFRGAGTPNPDFVKGVAIGLFLLTTELVYTNIVVIMHSKCEYEHS
jgi:hypothetical protein